MSRLDPLQREVLRVLVGMDPPWSLAGGAALIGFYGHHRTTEDLDLFFRGVRELGHAVAEAERRLVDAGFTVEAMQATPGFHRTRATRGGGSVVVDLVAEPMPPIVPPREPEPGLRVDDPHEILVNKLCALLSRSEPRDLEDVRVLVEAGGDLQRALGDAPRKDGGFSPLTLAWVLQSLPLHRAGALGFDRAVLEDFREVLQRTLTAGDGSG